MKTFLDRFRRKGKGDELSEGVHDLFAETSGGATETKTGAAVTENGVGTHAKPTGITLTPVPTRPSEDHVRLELGDFLHRIPQNLLRPGPHNVSTELLFNINELSLLIANGQTTINLAEIHRRVPDVFKSEVKVEDRVEIRFPWQKLMHLVKSPAEDPSNASGITPAAAEALAQKIRSRRPARNTPPISGSPTTKTPPAPPTPAFREPTPEENAPTEKPGKANSQQLSWFTKPGAEEPPDALTTPALPAPVSAELLAADREAIAEERDRAVAELNRTKSDLASKISQIEEHKQLGSQQAQKTAASIAQRDALQQEVTAKDAQLASLSLEIAALKNSGTEVSGATRQGRDTLLADLANFRKELAEKNEQIEFHQSMGTKSAEDAAELAADRDARQSEVAAKTSELEALRGELQEIRKGGGEKFAAVAEERDSIRAELARAREELAAKISEVETQKSLADKAAEEFIAAASERDALQLALAEKSGHFESLPSELVSHKKGGTGKVSAIEHERNSLLQKKTKLTEQLAQATAGLAAKQKAVVESDLSRKENQRQLEELQKRIAAFESGQRATAQELTRERETRIKAERSLAAAERARQEASALIESMRSETKRESDSVTRKRESEFARAQKDLQGRIEALTEANKKALAERDERTQEIETVRNEAAAAIESIKASVNAEAAQGAPWETRAIAGFEEDIAKYRDRIKALLGERDAAATTAAAQIEELTHARDTAALELEKANSAIAKSTSDQAGTIEELRAKAATIEQEKVAIIEDLDQTRKALAERAELEKSGDSALADTRRQVAERQQSLDAAASERADFDKKLEVAASERAELLASQQSASSETAEKLQAQEKLAGDLRSEIAELKASIDTTAADRAGLKQQIDDANARLEQAKTDYEKQVSELHTAHESQLESHRASSGDLAKTVAEHTALVASLHQQIEESKSAHAHLTGEHGKAHQDLEAAMLLLDQARADHEAKVASLQAGHTEALSKHQSASEELSRIAKEHEQAVESFRGEIAGLHDATKGHESARAQLQKDLEAAMALLDQARSEHDAQVAKLQAGHEETLSKEQAAAEELVRSVKDQEQAVAALRGEVAELQKSAKENESEGAQLQKKLDAAKAEAKKTKADFEKQLVAARAGYSELHAAHQVATNDFSAALLAHEGTVATLKNEIQQHLTVSAADLEKTKAEHDQQLSAARTEQAEVTSKLRAATDDFAKAKTEHASALAALQDALSNTKAGATGQLESARAAHDELRAQIAEQERAFNETKKELENRVADAERATAEIADRAQSLDTIVRNRDNALAERDADIARLKEEHETALVARGHEHAAGLESLTAEKDRQHAALTVERAKVVAGLSRERDDFAAKLADLEQSLTAQITSLTEARDEAIRESAALAQRLAAFAVESDGKFADLQRLHQEAVSERQTLTSQLDAAREEHKAQSGVFAREFKGVVKQRDDVTNALGTARADLAEKSDALARERANLAEVESDIAARFEREVTRMRRERDVLVRQRDELHGRISKMVEEQREMLEEFNAQTARRSPQPTDVVQKPHTERKRTAKESNVIEITAADIVPHHEPDRGINLPRVRPVLIRPPNVRIL